MEEVIRQWLAPLVAVASLAFTVFSARGKAAAERVAAIEKKVEAKADRDVVLPLIAKVDILEDRTARLEGTIQHMPSREQTHELALALREMKGELGVLTERLKPISHTTERLQEFLIDEAKVKRGAA